MLKGAEQDLFEFFKENMESEASIIYKKEPGMDGNETLKISGFGAVLFDGVCTILKGLAVAEAKQNGNDDMAAEYVDLVYKMVSRELINIDKGTPQNETSEKTDKTRVISLRPGQTIRFESGASDNWIRLEIREVHILEKLVVLKGKSNGYQEDYSFQPDEMVEVLDGR